MPAKLLSSFYIFRLQRSIYYRSLIPSHTGKRDVRGKDKSVEKETQFDVQHCKSILLYYYYITKIILECVLVVFQAIN